MATWQVGTYRLYLYAGRESGRALIRMEEQGGPNALHASFTTEKPLPTNSVNGSFYWLYFPYDMFLPMMEMLREEKPVWVYALNAANVYIGTSQEPIGEDEGP
jgi:hypothetical protein